MSRNGRSTSQPSKRVWRGRNVEVTARPVLERMRAQRPEVQLAYTFFSPSAVSLADRLPVDFRDYLVFDAAADTAAAVAALAPNALVFSKLDVWPNLVAAARPRPVRLGLSSGTMAPRSSPQSGLARALLRDAYRSLDVVGAIDAADADRLVDLGVRREIVQITGDTRYDQVWQRPSVLDRLWALIEPLTSSRP